ncbi:SRPBCC domain-containing protein [Planctomycetota bacterium]|nr:SRPBCC domain-containing protein [Planctomycetota bacterium]
MPKIIHQIGVVANVNEVYDAVGEAEAYSRWWSAKSYGECKVGGELTLEFPGYATHVWKFVEMKENELVVLKNLSGPEPWRGSELRFELKEGSGQVWLKLIHTVCDDLSEDEVLYFNTKWPTFLVSMKMYLEQGEGRPYPGDVQIQG